MRGATARATAYARSVIRSLSLRTFGRSCRRSLRFADVCVLIEPRCADAEEDEVVIADVGDALRHVCRNPHDVTLVDEGGRQISHLNAPFAADDDVTLDDTFEPMRRCGRARTHARPRN